MYRNIKKSERQSIVCDSLDRFSMVEKKISIRTSFRAASSLVAIARAMIASPKLILPMSRPALDSSQGKEIMEMFKKLNDEGTTIVQVTHNEKNAEYGNRIIQIEDGWIKQ